MLSNLSLHHFGIWECFQFPQVKCVLTHKYPMILEHITIINHSVQPIDSVTQSYFLNELNLLLHLNGQHFISLGDAVALKNRRMIGGPVGLVFDQVYLICMQNGPTYSCLSLRLTLPSRFDMGMW